MSILRTENLSKTFISRHGIIAAEKNRSIKRYKYTS